MDFVALINKLHNIEAKYISETAKEKKVDEEDTQEGNEFSGELAKAKAAGKKDFEVDGKKYQVKEAEDKKHEDEKSKDTDLEESDDEDADDDKEKVEESELKEKSAPGQEDWIKSNKEKFIKQYGKKKGLEVLYATSWKRSKKKDESKNLEECYNQAMMGGGQQEQESGMNINASTDTRTGSKSLTVTAQGQAAEQLAQLLKLSGLSGGQAAQEQPMGEEYANEPHVNVQTVEPQLQQGTDLNRPKNSFKHSYRQGDNPMAMQEAELRDIERRLNEELAAFKVVAEAKGKKPDFLDMDKDGDKKEPMKKALKDKGVAKDKK
jgi:hypothetical protein